MPNKEVSKTLIGESSLFNLIKSFVDDHPVPKTASLPLRDNASVEIQLQSGFLGTFKKVKGVSSFVSSRVSSPDIILIVSRDSIVYILKEKTLDIGNFGVRTFDCIFSNDKHFCIRAKLNIGFLEFYKKGYMRVLKQGGVTLMKYLACRGIKNISQVRQAYRKVRMQSYY